MKILHKIGIKSLFLLIAILFYCNNLIAKTNGDFKIELRIDSMDIYFGLNESVVLRDYRVYDHLSSNQEQIDSIKRLVDSNNNTVYSISVAAFASPDGGLKLNTELTKKRAEGIQAILNEEFKNTSFRVDSVQSGIAWEQLKRILPYTSLSEEEKEGILYIINNEPVETWGYKNPNDKWESLLRSRLSTLMNYKGGQPYIYLRDKVFPSLRYSKVIINYKAKIYLPDTAVIKRLDTDTVKKVELSLKTVQDTVPKDTTIFKPIIAIKTNLLYDIITAYNFEIEVPIGKHWSIAGEYILPWWLMDGKKSSSTRTRLQMHTGNLDVKYWFRTKEDRPIMTGWYLGAYFTGGIFDMEWDANGYQGELLGGGLTAGYAHAINKRKNLRLEYSLSLGYTATKYRKYKTIYDPNYECGIPGHINWHPVTVDSGLNNAFGPTKVKISLVWLIHSKKTIKLEDK